MITITVPDNASLEVVIKAFSMEMLRIHHCEVKAAKQMGINRNTLASWLEEWGIIPAYVKDGPNVIAACKRKKKPRVRAVPRTAPSSKPVAKRAGLQSIMDEAAAIRAAHERRRATG